LSLGNATVQLQGSGKKAAGVILSLFNGYGSVKGGGVQGRQGLDGAQQTSETYTKLGTAVEGQVGKSVGIHRRPFGSAPVLSGGRAGRANAVYFRHRPGCALVHDWSDSLGTAWRQEIQGAFSKVIVLAFLGRGRREAH